MRQAPRRDGNGLSSGPSGHQYEKKKLALMLARAGQVIDRRQAFGSQRSAPSRLNSPGAAIILLFSARLHNFSVASTTCPRICVTRIRCT
jgi:hypothetical protein